MNCYSFTRYNPLGKIGIIEYTIGNSDKISTIIHDTNSLKTELIGIITLLEQLDENKKYIIHTNSLCVLGKDNIREKNHMENFWVKRD